MVTVSINELTRNNGAGLGISSVLAIHRNSISSKHLATKLLSFEKVGSDNLVAAALGLLDHYHIEFPRPTEDICFSLYNTEFDVALVTKRDPIIFVHCVIATDDEAGQIMKVIGQPLANVYVDEIHPWWEHQKHLHIEKMTKKLKRSRFSALAMDKKNK